MEADAIGECIATALILSLGPIMIALSVPLALGKIKPNLWYGFRTAKTLSDPKIWFPANRICGKSGILVGTLLFATNVGIEFVLQGDHALIAHVIAISVWIGVWISHGFWKLQQL